MSYINETRRNFEDAPKGDNKDEKRRSVRDVSLNSTSERMRTAEKSGNTEGSAGSSWSNDSGRVPTRDTDEKGGIIRRVGNAQEQAERSVRGTPKALWMAVMALALALLGVTWYGHLALQKNDIPLSQLPGIQQLVAALGGRMDATEAKLRDLTANWDGLVHRVAELDRKVSSSLQVARKQTQELIAQAQERIQAEIDKRTQVIDARLARVESNQEAERERLAQLQEQLAKEVGNVRQEVAAGREDTGRDLAGLHQQVDQSQPELHALARRLDRQRVDFELAKNVAEELVPGVSLTVTRTNVSYQRFEGYLWVLADRRTLWLPNVGAQQAVAFYSKEDGQPYELVVTGVKKDGVVGYLLVPAGGNQGGSETAGAGATTTVASQRSP